MNRPILNYERHLHRAPARQIFRYCFVGMIKAVRLLIILMMLCMLVTFIYARLTNQTPLPLPPYLR